MVKLPKKVAKAIESVRERRSDERTLFNYPSIAHHATKNEDYNVINIYINQSEENFKNYFNAIVNGYETDKSPEEKIKERYLEYRELGLNVSANAIREAVTLLEMQIEGVNA